MATIIIYATNDGTPTGSTATWATTADSASAVDTSSTTLYAGVTFSGGFYVAQEYFTRFDTAGSPFPDSATVAIQSTMTTTLTRPIQCSSYDWGTTVEVGDFRSRSQLAGLTVLDGESSFTTSQYADWSIGGAAVNTSGFTSLVFFSEYHRLDIAPSASARVLFTSTSSAGTTSDPYLTIDYTIQAFRPDADLAATGWSTAPLFSKVNEASADGTVISATAV
jgi:hypothetical protein